jgi:hypothetical protein
MGIRLLHVRDRLRSADDTSDVGVVAGRHLLDAELSMLAPLSSAKSFSLLPLAPGLFLLALQRCCSPRHA